MLNSAQVCFYNTAHNATKFALKGPGAVIFNSGCNEQVFLLNLEKNLAQTRLVVFEKKDA